MLTTSQAARVLDVSAERIRQFAAQGALKSTATPLGKLYDPADVHRLAEERRQHRSNMQQFASAGTPDAAA